MIYQHFIGRLILCLISGLLFIAAFRHLAISNPVKELPTTNKYKWIGIVFYSLCVLQLIAFIYFFTQIVYPLTTAEPIIPLDGIVRSSSVHIVWGYATPMQRFAFTFFIGIFACYGFAQYFLKFKPSPSKWWSKILKFIGYVIVWMLYVNSTDFHYFDTSEWIKTGLYLFSLWICFAPSSKPKKEKAEESSPLNTTDDVLPPPYSDTPKDEDIASPISTSHEIVIDSVNISEEVSTSDTIENSDTIVEPSDSDIRYCRYCGHKIEADSKFCKYCGKPTGVKTVSANAYFNNFLTFCRGLKSKIIIPKIHIKKSELNNSKFLSWLKFIAPICLVLGIIGIILSVIYFNHYWNYSAFECRGVQDFFATFIGFSIAIAFFGLLSWLFAYWHKKSKYHFIKVITLIFVCLTYIACLGEVVTTVVSIFKFDKYYTSIKLDNALMNPSSPLYKESIEKFNSSFYQSSLVNYYDNRLSILRNFAENGNAFSQYLLGKYYFELRDWNVYTQSYENPDYDRALYWFTKSADNGFAKGQRMLGQFYLGKVSNQYYDVPLATHYLEKAIAQNDPRSFYLIGLIYANSDNDKARRYWEKGASLGDEACKQCVESFSIPEDAIPVVEVVADTIAPY